MKLGVQFFVTGHTIDPVTLAKAVEDAGFDSFWVPEHATLPVRPTTPYPMTGGAIPAVAVTAHGEYHGPDRTLGAGFQAHLRKPLDPWELCRALASLTRKP